MSAATDTARLAAFKEYWETYRDTISLDRPALADDIDWLLDRVEILEHRIGVAEDLVKKVAAKSGGLRFIARRRAE